MSPFSKKVHCLFQLIAAAIYFLQNYKRLYNLFPRMRDCFAPVGFIRTLPSSTETIISFSELIARTLKAVPKTVISACSVSTLNGCAAFLVTSKKPSPCKWTGLSFSRKSSRIFPIGCFRSDHILVPSVSSMFCFFTNPRFYGEHFRCWYY